MKKTLSALLFLAASVLAASAFAQGPGHPPDPADLLARLTTLLTLTTAQQAQATTIFTNEQTALQPIETQMQTAHTSLAAAVKSNTTGTIDTLTAQIGSYHAQIMSVQSKAQAAFYAILTADQQTKYDSLHVTAGGGRGAFRPERPPQ
jgi:Spy/CpxP family protein refolding chaperone